MGAVVPKRSCRSTTIVFVAPGTLGLAATNDLTLVRAFAEIARAEWRASGIQKVYGYQVDVATEPRWYRIQTTFGESPKLNADIARELVLGFQGNALGPESVAQTIKHFPGDGAVDKGLDPHSDWGQWAVYPTPGSFFKYQLPPFQAAVEAGTSSIMSYYNNPSNEKSAAQFPREWWLSDRQQFDGVAAAYNTAILTRLLRGRMGFKGYVNTDSGVLTNNAFGVEKLTTPQRFAKAVKAGVSLFSDNNNPQGLLDAVRQGLLGEADLNSSVTLLLTEIFQLGLFENPLPNPALKSKMGLPESRQAALQAARESMTLLKNSGSLLPLGRDRKILVTGPTADSLISLNNGWSYVWQGSEESLYPKDRPTIRQAIEAKAGAANVTYVPGTKIGRPPGSTSNNTPTNMEAEVDIEAARAEWAADSALLREGIDPLEVQQRTREDRRAKALEKRRRAGNGRGTKLGNSQGA
jgi:beta-glucosidase-like glycosyl hydrolase